MAIHPLTPPMPVTTLKASSTKTSEKGFKIKHWFIPMDFLLLESVFDKTCTAKKSVDMI